MIDWLLDMNVDFPPYALKAQIWDIIKEQLKRCPEYNIDNLVKRVRPDVTIERLPPYHVNIASYFDVFSLERYFVKSFFCVLFLSAN